MAKLFYSFLKIGCITIFLLIVLPIAYLLLQNYNNSIRPSVPLVDAVLSKDYATAHRLIEAGHNIDEREPWKMRNGWLAGPHTALYFVTEQGNLEEMRYFVQHGAYPAPALAAAVANGNIAAMTYLMENCKVSPQAKILSDIYPARATVPVLNFLEQHGYKVEDLSQEGPLEDWAQHGEIAELRWMAERGVKFNRKILGDACRSKNLELIKFMVDDCRISPDNPKTDSGSPIQNAVAANHIPTLRYLIDHGADPTVVGSYYSEYHHERDTLLHIAAVYGAYDAMRYLIEEHQLDINAINDKNQSVLDRVRDYPCYEGEGLEEMVQYLIKRGAKPAQSLRENGTQKN